MTASETQVDLSDCYRQVLGLSEQMLDAAQKGDWDRLVKTEIERGRLIDRIRDINEGPAGEPGANASQRQTIEAILALDHQIKTLTHDWMHELRDILGSATAQRLLNRTYGE